jgi:hypothetical protein
MRRERRAPTRAAYGADYTRNLRWRYRPGHGAGSVTEPYQGGGSFGSGYGRAWGAAPHSPPTPYDIEYRTERRAPRRRPGTAARDYDRAYPYFGSAAAVEAAQGYPPGDTLVPETRPRIPWPPRRWYDEDYG